MTKKKKQKKAYGIPFRQKLNLNIQKLQQP